MTMEYAFHPEALETNGTEQSLILQGVPFVLITHSEIATMRERGIEIFGNGVPNFPYIFCKKLDFEQVFHLQYVVG